MKWRKARHAGGMLLSYQPKKGEVENGSMSMQDCRDSLEHGVAKENRDLKKGKMSMW